MFMVMMRWYKTGLMSKMIENSKKCDTNAMIYLNSIFYLIKFSCVNSPLSLPLEGKEFFSSFLFILRDLLGSFEVVALSDMALPEEVEQLCFPMASFSCLLSISWDSTFSFVFVFEESSIARKWWNT